MLSIATWPAGPKCPWVAGSEDLSGQIAGGWSYCLSGRAQLHPMGNRRRDSDIFPVPQLHAGVIGAFVAVINPIP